MCKRERTVECRIGNARVDDSYCSMLIGVPKKTEACCNYKWRNGWTPVNTPHRIKSADASEVGCERAALHIMQKTALSNPSAPLAATPLHTLIHINFLRLVLETVRTRQTESSTHVYAFTIEKY